MDWWLVVGVLAIVLCVGGPFFMVPLVFRNVRSVYDRRTGKRTRTQKASALLYRFSSRAIDVDYDKSEQDGDGICFSVHLRLPLLMRRLSCGHVGYLEWCHRCERPIGPKIPNPRSIPPPPPPPAPESKPSKGGY